MYPVKCDACGITWQGDEVPVVLHRSLPSHYPTMEIAERAAECYGWTPENRLKMSINVTGIEIPEEYDGVRYWQCDACRTMFDRFTGAIQDHLDE